MNLCSKNNLVEVIKNKLYWISDKTPPLAQSNSFYFCLDKKLKYKGFYSDFGPLNIENICKFVKELEKILKVENI